LLIPIQINADDILSQFQISEKEVESIIDTAIKNITAAFASEWEQTAMNTLGATKNRYVSNIKVIDSGRMEGTVLLDYSKDPLIKMLEEGSSAFDMKENFAKSSKKKLKANGSGWYLTVPFSIGTPGASATGFANIMPSEIYAQVKNKTVSPETGRSQGLTKNEIPEQYQIPKVRAAIIIPESAAFKEYKQKTSQFQGLYKKTDSTTGQSSYGSFRRVSDKSDSDSWIHPGIEAMNLAEKTIDSFDSKIQTILEDSMSSALSYFGLE
jgi:hypothetical protein